MQILEKCWQNVKTLGLFKISWDNLTKRKSNLCQKCVKSEVLSFQGKNGTVAPFFPGQMTVSSLICRYFSTRLFLKSGVVTHTKQYIFRISNKIVIR